MQQRRKQPAGSGGSIRMLVSITPGNRSWWLTSSPWPARQPRYRASGAAEEAESQRHERRHNRGGEGVPRVRAFDKHGKLLSYYPATIGSG
jgi:hypothetical protein